MDKLLAGNLIKQKGKPNGAQQNGCWPPNSGGMMPVPPPPLVIGTANVPRIQITQSATIDEIEGQQQQRKEQLLGLTSALDEGMRAAAVSTTSSGTTKSRTTAAAAGMAGTARGDGLEPMGQPKGATTEDGALLSANRYQDRAALNRQSTGTLNRLILVAQALESEADWRRRNDMNSSRIVYILRMANIVFLLLINVLIFTGVGQYHGRDGLRFSLFLTLDKWYFQPGYFVNDLPPTFSEMRLTGQFCAATLAVLMLVSTLLVQSLHCFRIRHSKSLCIFYAFACVPFTLFIFGLEMHYSTCPWLDDFYQRQVLRRNFNSVEKYFDTQCGINGWALAGIFSLLSCGLFVSDGLISAFFRTDNSHADEERDKPEAIV